MTDQSETPAEPDERVEMSSTSRGVGLPSVLRPYSLGPTSFTLAGEGEPRWRRPSGVPDGENAVEVAVFGARIAVRHSSGAGVLLFTRGQLAAFFNAVRAGEFNDLARPPVFASAPSNKPDDPDDAA